MIGEGDLAFARRIAHACYGGEPRVEPLPASHHALLRLYAPDGVKIAKLAAPGSASAIAKEVAVLALLRERGLPVPLVEHADPRGESGRAYLVMADAGPRTVLDLLREPGDTPLRLLREMGELHARIHGVELPQPPPWSEGEGAAADPAPLLRELAALARALEGEGVLARGEAERFAALRLPPHVGRALCHGDYHAVQCVARMGRIAAVVDWEAAWLGNPAIDCAVTQAYLEQYAPASLVHAYLQGYASVRALPADYGTAYLPVRMVQVIGVLRAWRRQGASSWQAAVAQGRVERALRQYRLYAAALAR